MKDFERGKKDAMDALDREVFDSRDDADLRDPFAAPNSIA
jgi:hypothetical protein